jgi:septal ring-binding cell division protein DamX
VPDYLDTQPLDEAPSFADAEDDQHSAFTFDAEPPSEPSYEIPQYQWLSHSQPLEVPEAYIQAGANSQPLAEHPEPAQVEQPQEVVHSRESGTLASTSPDPWADPLPAWETSRNEWPVLVEPQKSSRFSNLKIPIAVVLLVVSLAALFFVVILPLMRSNTSGPTQTVKPTPTETAKPSAPDAPPASPQTEASQPSAPLAASSTPAPQAEDLNNQGTVTLQVMSSPNEAEAKGYAEKLTRAGVSAYVVAAEIKGKGRWYRVRAGRFNTREEAQRYAEQSKARARAAGVKLDTMIPVDYEKP